MIAEIIIFPFLQKKNSFTADSFLINLVLMAYFDSEFTIHNIQNYKLFWVNIDLDTIACLVNWHTISKIPTSFD